MMAQQLLEPIAHGDLDGVRRALLRLLLLADADDDEPTTTTTTVLSSAAPDAAGVLRRPVLFAIDAALHGTLMHTKREATARASIAVAVAAAYGANRGLPPVIDATRASVAGTPLHAEVCVCTACLLLRRRPPAPPRATLTLVFVGE